MGELRRKMEGLYSSAGKALLGDELLEMGDGGLDPTITSLLAAKVEDTEI